MVDKNIKEPRTNFENDKDRKIYTIGLKHGDGLKDGVDEFQRI
jgi:hypothetical protein